MAALDGKITIESGLRPCITSVSDFDKFFEKVNIESYKDDRVFKIPKKKVKAIFHCWHPVTGNAIVEYEDGTIHEVELTQIQFVDNAMRKYAFPEMKKNTDKVKNEWKPLKRVNHVCPKCGQGRMKLDEGIVLTSNPPQYRYQCDKCGYVECSSGQIEVSEIDEYESL